MKFHKDLTSINPQNYSESISRPLSAIKTNQSTNGKAAIKPTTAWSGTMNFTRLRGYLRISANYCWELAVKCMERSVLECSVRVNRQFQDDLRRGCRGVCLGHIYLLNMNTRKHALFGLWISSITWCFYLNLCWRLVEMKEQINETKAWKQIQFVGLIWMFHVFMMNSCGKPHEAHFHGNTIKDETWLLEYN